ncbi:fumarylacetoacetate hydrolase family protein [Pyrenophora tritici-repentis Pt-1C-BFP]|uniref:Fumarylacetoacetate hydrolase family protein n=1 Tax=Pyrenophora tritici-repentis (strain Pt-1C-BFP) TaxID=426418 RepID=B2WAH1_PYRTR|nr:fumarylacetoacetate hydrolase family protein [Pyrenophora tritici-repentis Pt-1C-BFP]EDU50203.1 fumarylacetoacetate hydrolase family protein [Pyrenophora tritici-repentis Pt-1C-BFP]
MPPNWDRLIRFIATDDRELRGQPILPSPDFDVGTTTKETKLKANVISVKNNDIFDPATAVTDEVVTVKKLLGPVTQQEDNQADYEGELCFIISRDAKDVLASSARSYIGAYLAGNDVSSRKLQRDPLLAGTVPQWNFSKGFDTFAPLGPQLVNSAVVGDVNRLELRTTVNGEVRQQSGIEDLLFKVEELVSYFSQGTTLKKGTVFMTGTCAGVGYAMAEPQFLKPGDVVEVRIWPEVGTLRNWVEFA